MKKQNENVRKRKKIVTEELNPIMKQEKKKTHETESVK